MSGGASQHYDVAIVGGGPVGSYCALAYARSGARVALLEADPRASRRLGGEWLHPSSVRMLRDVGIDVDMLPRSTAGKGFVVFPEDGSQPIELPYMDGSRGLVCEQATLVSSLREAIENETDVEYIPGARVTGIENERVGYTGNGTGHTLTATRIVGADGRASVVRQSLGLPTNPMPCSWMLVVTLSEGSLPLEGYGHVFLGGPGLVFSYRLAEDCVRVLLDVPLDLWSPGARTDFLSDPYVGLLPEALRSGFVEMLRADRVHVVANRLGPRVSYGSQRHVLVGDAAGHYHPMTAMGLTLGFGDALELVEGGDSRDFATRRFRAIRAPEFLAMALYEVFADHRTESLALRQTVYRGWRKDPAYRYRAMRMLSGEDWSPVRLGIVFGSTVVRVFAAELARPRSRRARRQASNVLPALTVRLWRLLCGHLLLSKARRRGGKGSDRARDSLARAYLVSMPSGTSAPRPMCPGEVEAPDAGPALASASARLLSLQGQDGSWEGEHIWCPMPTAQYVLLHHIIGRPLEPGRRRRMLRYFERTRLEGGAWGLHEHSPPHLFVTTLVYVAARLLGAGRDDPLVEPARRFIQEEGVLGIPTWGKFWLALLNLYDWRGVNAVLPELWCLPRRLPLHPSNWFCHARHLYMAMAVICAHRFQAPVAPLIESLREELFPQGLAGVDFSAARGHLRDADLYARPSLWLRAGYGLARLFERVHGKRLRARCMDAIVGRIRWELQTTSHTSISPVSGVLSILALWLHDPDNADFQEALAQLDVWIWEDEEEGARVTIARNATWDTGFALQALAALPEPAGVADALERGAGFLLGDQIGTSFEGFREAYRSDPRGGWCFAGAWHGWPVSDCTAEAVLGLIAARGGGDDRTAFGDAVAFMLRGQNRDGGFGSYEARRSAFGLEWLNPSEIFGNSMTEHSFVECTASCLAALAACRERFPEIADGAADAVSRAESWLRRTQETDGSWRGVWGVQFIYGTLFGIRGLLAAGARPGDPALRSACRWLLDRQRQDGGWGEHHSGCLTGRYVAHEESQVIQTAWALIALLEAGDSNWNAISRGARFLLDAQQADGAWPRQDVAGAFLRTGVVHYDLYRQYFPLHALGLYERRRRGRLGPAVSLTADATPPSLEPAPA